MLLHFYCLFDFHVAFCIGTMTACQRGKRDSPHVVVRISSRRSQFQATCTSHGCSDSGKKAETRQEMAERGSVVPRLPPPSKETQEGKYVCLSLFLHDEGQYSYVLCFKVWISPPYSGQILDSSARCSFDAE